MRVTDPHGVCRLQFGGSRRTTSAFGRCWSVWIPTRSSWWQA